MSLYKTRVMKLLSVIDIPNVSATMISWTGVITSPDKSLVSWIQTLNTSYFSRILLAFMAMSSDPLGNDKINDLCILWRKSLRKMWVLPYDTHCYTLPLVGKCLPLYDENCGSSLSFNINAISMSKSIKGASIKKSQCAMISKQMSFQLPFEMFVTQVGLSKVLG